jgi:diguanylate cyclase (GGDEF)-like protein/PAS domain S-box-containing protein
MRALVGKSTAELQATSQIEALHRKVLAILQGTKVFKIKVYDLKGMTIYSTDRKQIGEDKGRNAGVLAGLRGLNSSNLVHQNQVSTFEGEVQNRDVVESYVPRYDPTNGAVSGVFEIYGDATDLLAEIGKRQWTIFFSVIALLALLYLAMVMIVKRAQHLIINENHARKKAQDALTLSEERWKFALEGAGDGVWDRNLETGEVVVSKRYKEIYGFHENELTNHQEAWNERVHPDDLARIEADRNAYLSGKTQTYANERRMQCRDGSWKWILSRGMVVARDAHGKPLRMIGTHSDISERKVMEERLHQQAHFDSLTGLPNRALFTDRLSQTLAKARRDQTRMALMFIDLDKFKPVNDLLGHQVGDLLLKAVAKRLSECVRRQSDTVGRLGGDEFVVMLPEIEASENATAVAEKILHALSLDFQIEEHNLQISSSIGIALFPEHGKDENLLLKSADAAMYQAKEDGRNRIQVAQSDKN